MKCSCGQDLIKRDFDQTFNCYVCDITLSMFDYHRIIEFRKMLVKAQGNSGIPMYNGRDYFYFFERL